MPKNKIICGAMPEATKVFPNGYFNCCISSPPYWALRDYGVDGQLGLEPTFEEYIDKLCTIYDEVKRVLRDDGTCWVNLGDTYFGGNKGEGGKSSKQLTNKGSWMDGKPFKTASNNLPDKSLCLIPQRFAIEMVNRGWILRNVIIWHKPNPMPSSAKDRFTVDFEYVYFFVKSKKYWFEPQYEPYVLPLDRWGGIYTDGNVPGSKYLKEDIDPAQLTQRPRSMRPNALGRNKRTVWTIPTQPFSGWTQTYRLVLGEPDGACDGRIHITSPNCPEHGGLFDLFAMLFGDVRGDDVLSRISRIYDYLCQVQPDDFVPTVPPHIYYCGRYNWGYLLRQCFPSATDRNSESYKKAHALLTNPSYRLYARRLERIVHILVSHGLSEQGKSIYESKTWPDGLDAHLLGQMFFRIVDKSSFQKLLKKPNCQCGLYHISIQETSHFATFPEKLVEPMIKAGCPEFVCTKCGKAREKIYEIIRDSETHSDNTAFKDDGSSRNFDGMRWKSHPEFKGYTDCGCNPTVKDSLIVEKWRPGIVMDIFAGSGTTLQVAARLRRDWIGVELKPEYIKMAEKRASQGETGISVKEQRRGQMALFKKGAGKCKNIKLK